AWQHACRTANRSTTGQAHSVACDREPIDTGQRCTQPMKGATMQASEKRKSSDVARATSLLAVGALCGSAMGMAGGAFGGSADPAAAAQPGSGKCSVKKLEEPDGTTSSQATDGSSSTSDTLMPTEALRQLCGPSEKPTTNCLMSRTSHLQESTTTTSSSARAPESARATAHRISTTTVRS